MKQRLLILIVMLGSALLVSACNGLHSVIQQRGDDLEQLSEMRQWPAERVEAELPVLERNYNRNPDDENRLRLAIALGFGQCSSCNPARAVELLQTLVATGTDRTAVAMASIYLELLEARAKVVSTQAQLQQQQEQNLELLEARAKVVSTQAQLQQQLEQLQQQQEQITQLQKKLKELTSIEESLHQRE